MFALNICLAVNLIILFIAFFFRANNTLPNKILALLLLDTAISFLGNASVVGGFFTTFPYIFFLSWCTSCFFGPLCFAYTSLFTGGRLRLTHPIWLFAFLNSAFGLIFPVHYLMLPVKERAQFVSSLMTEPLPWEMTVINSVTMILILTCIVISAVRVKRYKTRLLGTVSNLEKTKLTFITQFVVLVFILNVATIILYLILPQYQVEYLYLPSLITCIYFFILFYTFRHHTLFTPQTYQQFLEAILPASEVKQIEVDKVILPPTELQRLAAQVDEYLTQTKVYTDPDLSIEQLANGLRVSVDKLSAAINRELHKNFFDLINEKRVERAKQLLSDKIRELTVEAIAYEAGFNSRASFYRAFKKVTGFTPSSYLQQQKN